MKQYVVRSDAGIYLDDNALPTRDLASAHKCDSPEKCLAFMERNPPPDDGNLYRVCELTPDGEVVPL